MQQRKILNKGTILHLIPECAKVNDKKEYQTERSWIIGDVVGIGSSTVCYQASCDNKIGILKEFNPRKYNREKICYKTEVKKFSIEREIFLESYREIDRLRRIDIENRKINNFLPAYEILYDMKSISKANAYIWLLDNNIGLTFEQFLKKDAINNEKLNDEKIYRILSIIISLTECTKEFHSVGLYNLDIKPSNFLLYFPWDENPDYCQVSLFDVDSMIVCTNKPRFYKVTDRYSAPELYRGYGDNRSDIYSLGVLIYDALLSDTNIDEDVDNDIYKNNDITVGDISESYCVISNLLGNICRKTLAQNPNNRYDNCEELLKDLMKVKRCLLKKKLEKDDEATKWY